MFMHLVCFKNSYPNIFYTICNVFTTLFACSFVWYFTFYHRWYCVVNNLEHIWQFIDFITNFKSWNYRRCFKSLTVLYRFFKQYKKMNPFKKRVYHTYSNNIMNIVISTRDDKMMLKMSANKIRTLINLYVSSKSFLYVLVVKNVHSIMVMLSLGYVDHFSLYFI